MVCEEAIILFEADNGLQVQEKLKSIGHPDLILLDVHMPSMDGFATVEWLVQNHPEIDVLVVSMIVHDESIIRLLKMGVKGYVGKDVEPEVLGVALRSVRDKGFFYTDFITGKLIHVLRQDVIPKAITTPSITAKEKAFLQLVCTDLTYAEIAARMYLSPKTIDGYRDAMFEKYGVKSRVGLAMYAIKQKWVEL